VEDPRKPSTDLTQENAKMFNRKLKQELEEKKSLLKQAEETIKEMTTAKIISKATRDRAHALLNRLRDT